MALNALKTLTEVSVTTVRQGAHMGWDEGQVREAAGRQHGMIDRATVLGLGGTDAQIKQRLANRLWLKRYPGVYDMNVTLPDWKSRLQAAVLAAGPDARASHRAALRLWGIKGVNSRILEITVPYSELPEPADVLVHRTRRVLPSSEIEAIPVTTVERTLLDLAVVCPPSILEKAASDAIHQKLTTLDLIGATLTEQGGRGVRGTRKLRRVLEDVAYDSTGSPAEVDLARLMRSALIPSPVCQMALTLPNGDHAYPDFGWPERRKLIEVDGFEAHGSPEALQRDLIRQNLLLEMGWEMRRFSARIIRTKPEEVVRDIQSFLAD